jgi:hypothetical protein
LGIPHGYHPHIPSYVQPSRRGVSPKGAVSGGSPRSSNRAISARPWRCSWLLKGERPETLRKLSAKSWFYWGKCWFLVCFTGENGGFNPNLSQSRDLNTKDAWQKSIRNKGSTTYTGQLYLQLLDGSTSRWCFFLHTRLVLSITPTYHNPYLLQLACCLMSTAIEAHIQPYTVPELHPYIWGSKPIVPRKKSLEPIQQIWQLNQPQQLNQPFFAPRWPRQFQSAWKASLST